MWKEIPSVKIRLRALHPCSLPKGRTGGKSPQLDILPPGIKTFQAGMAGGGDAQAALGAHQYQVTARTEVKIWANPATNYPREAELEPSPFLWEAAPGPARSILLPKAMEGEQEWFPVSTPSL